MLGLSWSERLPDLKLRVALVDLKGRGNKVADIVPTVLGLSDRIAGMGARLMCFAHFELPVSRCPQCGFTGAIALEGQECTAIADRAAELGISVSLGLPLMIGNRLFSSRVLFSPQSPPVVQNRVHLARPENIYDPGDAWHIARVSGWCIGSVGGMDSLFFEPYRILAIKGAHCIFVDAVIHGAESIESGDNYPCWAPARAYENRIFIFGFTRGVNRLSANITNRCFVFAPGGEYVAGTSTTIDGEQVSLIDLDPGIVKAFRVNAGHFLALRRVSTYIDILNAYNEGEP